jgi:hypothetical protein
MLSRAAAMRPAVPDAPWVSWRNLAISRVRPINTRLGSAPESMDFSATQGLVRACSLMRIGHLLNEDGPVLPSGLFAAQDTR